MTTMAQLINRTKNHLLGNTREEVNQLAAGYTAGGTTLTMTFPLGGIQVGAEIEVGLEVFRVMAVSGLDVTVIGAQKDSTAANHSSGDLVIVNPRFYASSIFTDINHTLHDLSGEGLYREATIDVTYNPVVAAYDMTGTTTDEIIDVLEVRYRITGPTKRQPVIRHWSLMRDMPTDQFASGTGLVVDSGGFPGLPIRVRYAKNFTEMTALTDDVTTTAGLRDTADDLPPIGAALRQMMGRDIKRSFLEAQPDTRRSNEVPSGAAQNAMRELRRLWVEGVEAERMRQVQRFPYRLAR